jgi:hypothetical protein
VIKAIFSVYSNPEDDKGERANRVRDQEERLIVSEVTCMDQTVQKYPGRVLDATKLW